MELIKNKIYRCQIVDYTADGTGLAKIDGRAVFCAAHGGRRPVRRAHCESDQKRRVRTAGKADRAVRCAD